MDLSKLSYSKSGVEKEQRPSVIRQISLIEEPPIQPENLDIDPAYQKTDGTLSPSLIFVLSGGEKREKDFLIELIRQKKFQSLRVLFISEKEQGLQPYQMKEKWEAIQRSRNFEIDGQIYELKEIDKFFFLSDVDEFYDQLVQILRNKPQEEQDRWIISNPCFEIWLYYCYLNNPEEDLASLRSESVRTRSKKFKTLGPTLVSGGLNPRLAFEHMMVGIEHSQAHYRIDENGIPELFSTKMHLMSQYMVETMNTQANEYTKYINQKKEWREAMTKKSLSKSQSSNQ